MLFLNDLFTFISNQRLGMLIGICLPLIALLFFAKYRSIWASIWFLPVIYFAISLILTIPQVGNFVSSYNLITYSLEGFEFLLAPFFYIHELVMRVLGMILPEVTFLHEKIFAAQWFPLVLYGLIWIIFLAIFRKRKKKNKVRRYEDDF